MKKLIVITGPTGSGKTDWSLKLADSIGGVIIAADSRTVYDKLDIGTNKVITDYDHKKENGKTGPVYLVCGIEHYGLDLVPLAEQFTAADFQRYVYNLLPSFWKRGKVPILVGGTGLYIDAVVQGFNFPNATQLDEHWSRQPLEKLISKLAQLDPETYRQIDLKNRTRIERALSYVLATQQSWSGASKKTPPDFRSQIYLVDRNREELYGRIDKRVDEWLTLGLIDEVRRLLKTASAERLRQIGQVYRASLRLIANDWTREQFRNNLKTELHNYARRQLTWWRNRPEVKAVSSYNELERNAKQFLN